MLFNLKKSVKLHLVQKEDEEKKEKLFSLLYIQSIRPFKTECHEQGMFPAINIWTGGSFPALLSGFHSSCDQDGGIVVLFFNFVSLLCNIHWCKY